MKKKLLIVFFLFTSCLGLIGCEKEETMLEKQIEKIDLTEEENNDLVKAIEKIDSVDYLGKSFQTSELTNDEMLRLVLNIFNPRGSGFSEMEFAYFNQSIAQKYFGYQGLEPKDITCSCGEVIATYNSSNEMYTWDSNYHYLNHTTNVYNEYIDAYKLGDKYMVEMYKIFPDLLTNFSSSQYNFYATYNEAVNQENILFTVTNETEFTNTLESLDNNKLKKYTYTFKLNEKNNYILIEYKIGK